MALSAAPNFTGGPLLEGQGQSMSVPCPICNEINTFQMPLGTDRLVVKCFKCNADFESVAEAQASPAATAAAVPVAQQQMTAQPVPAAMAPLEQWHSVESGVVTGVRLQSGVVTAVPMQAVATQPVAVQPLAVTLVGIEARALPNGELQGLPETPTQITCPRCARVVVSSVKYEMGTGSWVMCLGVCCLGWLFACLSNVLCWACISWLGFLPCCLNQCQDAHHQCPACYGPIGSKKFLL